MPNPLLLLSAPSAIPGAKVGGTGGGGTSLDVATKSSAESSLNSSGSVYTLGTGSFNFGGSSFNPVLIAMAVVAGLYFFMKK